MKLICKLATTCAFALLVPVSAYAQSGALADRGERLARSWCASCDAIPGHRGQEVLVDAPSFLELSSRQGLNEGQLAAILIGPHPVMPELPITRGDVASIIAYLERLRRAETTATNASNVGDLTDRGRRMAQTQCATCHAIEGPGPSRIADAPAFSTLSERYPLSHLEEALAEGIAVYHPEIAMPEFVFEPDEIAALLSYLESVQDVGPGR